MRIEGSQTSRKMETEKNQARKSLDVTSTIKQDTSR